MEKKKVIVNLVDQLLEIAQEDDRKHKASAIKAHKSSAAIGESKMIFHLKILKDLLKED